VAWCLVCTKRLELLWSEKRSGFDVQPLHNNPPILARRVAPWATSRKLGSRHGACGSASRGATPDEPVFLSPPRPRTAQHRSRVGHTAMLPRTRCSLLVLTLLVATATCLAALSSPAPSVCCVPLSLAVGAHNGRLLIIYARVWPTAVLDRALVVFVSLCSPAPACALRRPRAPRAVLISRLFLLRR